MVQPSGFAAYAAGVAMLEDGDAVEALVRLADGDADGLRDARAVLQSIPVEPERSARALLLVERAIAQVEGGVGPSDTTHRTGRAEMTPPGGDR